MSLDQHLSLEVVIQDVEDSPHPKGVARVYQFIGPAIEAPELDLPL